MLDALAQILLCGALALAFRWGLHRTDALGRPNRFPAGRAGAPARPCAAGRLAGCGTSSRATPARVGRLELIGTSVSVHCQTAGEAFVDAGWELGFVKYDSEGVPEHKTLIKQDRATICGRTCTPRRRIRTPTRSSRCTSSPTSRCTCRGSPPRRARSVPPSSGTPGWPSSSARSRRRRRPWRGPTG